MTAQRFTEYKMVHISEGGCGTLLLGSSGLPLKKIEAELNRYAAEGWQVVFQVLEMKRFWLFWQRECDPGALTGAAGVSTEGHRVLSSDRRWYPMVWHRLQL